MIRVSGESVNEVKFRMIGGCDDMTRGDESENTKKLIDWALGEEGQTLQRRMGYAPLGE